MDFLKDDIEQNLSSNVPGNIISALDFLAGSGTIKDLSKVMAFCKHRDPGVKAKAVHATVSIARKQLVQDFNAFNDSERAKLTTLVETFNPQVIKDFAIEISQSSGQQQLNAIRALALLKNPALVKRILIALLGKNDVKIKATVVKILGELINDTEQSLLLDLINNPDDRVRANVVEAIEKMRNPKLKPYLQRTKFDKNNRIRANTLKALYTLGDKSTLQDTRDMLTSSDEKMRASAAWLVSQIKIETEEISQICINLADDPNEIVKNNAIKALKSFKLESAKEKLKRIEKE